jgi:hypothetical protein
MATAHTILQQLGGQRFVALTGAANLVSYPGGLQMSVRGGRKVFVELYANDTYTVRMGRMNRKTFAFVVLAEETGIYADNLRATFTALTGLDTSL